MELDYPGFFEMISGYGRTLNVEERNVLFGRSRIVKSKEVCGTFVGETGNKILEKKEGVKSTSQSRKINEGNYERFSVKKGYRNDKIARERDEMRT